MGVLLACHLNYRKQRAFIVALGQPAFPFNRYEHRPPLSRLRLSRLPALNLCQEI